MIAKYIKFNISDIEIVLNKLILHLRYIISCLNVIRVIVLQLTSTDIGNVIPVGHNDPFSLLYYLIQETKVSIYAKLKNTCNVWI